MVFLFIIWALSLTLEEFVPLLSWAILRLVLLRLCYVFFVEIWNVKNGARVQGCQSSPAPRHSIPQGLIPNTHRSGGIFSAFLSGCFPYPISLFVKDGLAWPLLTPRVPSTAQFSSYLLASFAHAMNAKACKISAADVRKEIGFIRHVGLHLWLGANICKISAFSCEAWL